MNTTLYDMKSVEADLSEALFNLSGGKLNRELSEKIAVKVLNSTDANNSAFFHKGSNWYAKEILKKIGM